MQSRSSTRFAARWVEFSLQTGNIGPNMVTTGSDRSYVPRSASVETFTRTGMQAARPILGWQPLNQCGCKRPACFASAPAG